MNKGGGSHRYTGAYSFCGLQTAMLLDPVHA